MLKKLIEKNNSALTKLIFAFIIGFFLFVMLYGNIVQENNNFTLFPSLFIQKMEYSIIPKSQIINYNPNFLTGNINSNPYENCTVTKPSSIVVRIDDIGAWRNVEVAKNITDTLLANNISVVLGVIPEDIENDPEFMEWIRSIRDNPNIEIAQHGYLHEENEFENLTESQAYERIALGREEIIKYIGVIPSTFIPPYNVYSKGTLTALSEIGFKIITSGQVGYTSGNVSVIGYNARTYDFTTSTFIDSEKVLFDCKRSLQRNGYCVIMIHPQDYTTLKDGKRVLDDYKYADLLNLIEGLKGLNRDFSTLEDNLVCKI